MRRRAKQHAVSNTTSLLVRKPSDHGVHFAHLPQPCQSDGGSGEAVRINVPNHARAACLTLCPLLPLGQAYGRVDEDGARWLLGDHVGRMWLLVLGAAGGRVTGLRLEALGTTSIAQTLSYLDNGVV